MSINEMPRAYATLPTLAEAHCRAVIDFSALRHNYRTLRERAGNPTCFCVLKADAYGHGAPEAARALALEGCRFFAVSCLEEALALRAAVKEAEILIFGNLHPSHVPLLLQHRLTATLFSQRQARELADEAARLGGVLLAHLNLDTGMNRLGFPICTEEDTEKSLAEIRELFSLKSLSIRGIYSHFATADEEDRAATHAQAARFLAATKTLENEGFSLGLRHICNSAGALRYPEYAADAVRLGIALYGYAPDGAEDVDLLPVMRLESEVTEVHTMPAHANLGYGGCFTSDTPRTIATVGIGYADGCIRAFSGAEVTVHTATGDFRAPIVGRICMDQCMLDVTDLPVTRGDRVTVFGQTTRELTALAARAHTIPYECLCLISARVPRVLADESKNRSAQEAMQKILDHCAQSYREPLSLESLSEALGLSKYYISHLFGEYCHTSFSDYVARLRLEEACRYLKNTEKSAAEIAALVGFGSTRNFHRAFRKIYGLSPIQYREKNVK